MMQLSNFTIQLLRNFKGINSSLVVEPGKTISTVAEANNIIASADVDETFPQRFGIYDLGEFLSVLDLVSEPQISFNEKYATISDLAGRVNVKYFFSDPENLKAGRKSVNLNDFDIEFTLDGSTLNSLKRAASALGHETISITGTSNLITLSVLDKDNITSNQFSVDVGGTSKSPEYNLILNIANLRVIPADYDVSIAATKFAMRMVSKNLEKPVTYWIALEKSSRYTPV